MHVEANPYLNPPSLTNLSRFWKSPFQGLYVPVTYNLWGLETALSHMLYKGTLNANLFHVGNLLFHAANACWLYAILMILFSAPAAALVGAVFFALHPVQVEPVAWVSGLKDLACGFFGLACIWFYLKTYKDKVRSFYLLALLAFLLAELSKPAAIVIPLILGVLDYQFLKTSFQRLLIRLAPFFLVAIPISLITRQAQPERAMNFVTPWSGRFLIVCDSFSFYVSKLFLPFFLATDYSRTPQSVLAHPLRFLPFLVIISLLLLLLRRSSISKTATLIFISGLLPVLGIFPFYYQFFSTVADRYLYLALLGPALALAAYWHSMTGRLLPKALVMGVLLCLALLSHRQVKVWKNDEALFSNVLRMNPNSLMAHNNLGTVLEREDRFVEAAYHYTEAIRINTESLPARYNLGRVLARLGKFEQSRKVLEELLAMESRIADAHYILGMDYRELGPLATARLHFWLATRLDPKMSRAFFQLGLVLKAMGLYQDAIPYLRQNLELNPLHAQSHLLLSECYLAMGQTENARSELRWVLEREPKNEKALALLGEK